MSYAVIFIAEIAELDAEYVATAEHLRQLALNDYGCLEFTSFREGNREVAISYWDREEQILAWKQDQDHRRAQQQGRDKWYRSYRVQVVQISREYRAGPGF